MNIYGSLSRVKAELGLTTVTLDDSLLALMEEASRSVDDQTGRHFYALQNQVRYFDGPRAACGPLWLFDDDLLAVTEVATASSAGTYGTVLVADTDYWLWPDNLPAGSPYRRIDLNPLGALFGTYALGRRGIRITGTFGYSFETEATGTTAAEAIDDSETAIDVVSGTFIGKGETIVIDSEQMYVSDVAANTITVTRGVNGSIAATHLTGAAISRRRYPRPIELAVELEAVRMRWEMQNGYGGMISASEGGSAGGNVSKFGVLYPAIKTKVALYRRVAVA